jgi:hypothetical protein
MSPRTYACSSDSLSIANCSAFLDLLVNRPFTAPKRPMYISRAWTAEDRQEFNQMLKSFFGKMSKTYMYALALYVKPKELSYAKTWALLPIWDDGLHGGDGARACAIHQLAMIPECKWNGYS